MTTIDEQQIAAWKTDIAAVADKLFKEMLIELGHDADVEVVNGGIGKIEAAARFRLTFGYLLDGVMPEMLIADWLAAE